MSPEQRTLLARALVIIQELLSSPESAASSVANPVVPVSDLDRLAHAGAKIKPADRGQWQLLLDEHGREKLTEAVTELRPNATIESVRKRMVVPSKSQEAFDQIATILRNSSLPCGEAQVQDWYSLSKFTAGVTSIPEWEDFVLWAIDEAEKGSHDFRFANQYRQLAITWRRDRHERWVRAKARPLEAAPNGGGACAPGEEGVPGN